MEIAFISFLKKQTKINLKNSSNYLLDARETATVCTFQKSLIQAYPQCKTSPEKMGWGGGKCSKATKVQLQILLGKREEIVPYQRATYKVVQRKGVRKWKKRRRRRKKKKRRRNMDLLGFFSIKPWSEIKCRPF